MVLIQVMGGVVHESDDTIRGLRDLVQLNPSHLSKTQILQIIDWIRGHDDVVSVSAIFGDDLETMAHQECLIKGNENDIYRDWLGDEEC